MMKYEIVKLEEKVVAGIQIRTTNENGKAFQEIGDTWYNFFKNGSYEKIQNKVNHKTIGLYTEYEKDYTKPYTFLAGVETYKRIEGHQDLVVKVIPKGKYAKFVIIGDVQNSIGQAWKEIWDMDLKRTYTCDFEEYQNNSNDIQKQEVHIYIAIEE